MRALGLDLGSKRIGVALSDVTATIASPFTVIQRAKRRGDDHAAIATLVEVEEVDVVVVGMPLSMSGASGPAAQAAAGEVAALSTVLNVPVETYDERLTTVTADAAMMQAGMKAPARRQHVDKIAAAVMLQGWLDHRRNTRLPVSDGSA